jgi:hypothetical protein
MTAKKESKATKALKKACAELHGAIREVVYLAHDCELILERLPQDEFNRYVELCAGSLPKARKRLAKEFKQDLKIMLEDLRHVRTSIERVEAAMPAVAEAQLESLQDYDYTGEDDE